MGFNSNAEYYTNSLFYYAVVLFSAAVVSAGWDQQPSWLFINTHADFQPPSRDLLRLCREGISTCEASGEQERNDNYDIVGLEYQREKKVRMQSLPLPIFAATLSYRHFGSTPKTARHLAMVDVGDLL